MRHYYRFMELEPVLEMEEDSVGDESPTSSTGSPSLSPPPDVWAQLTGKEYHDSVYNLLLQDHLELQRAYRVLEVQYRNYEKRAGRDATEAAAQVRALKDTLKEVLMTQESDKLLAVKEDLQRVREREAKLKEEAYDLREQNELLEFRILELEECHENSSMRGVLPETREVGTSMEEDDGITYLLSETKWEQTSLINSNTSVTPDSTLTLRKELATDVIQYTEVTCHQPHLHKNGDNKHQQTLESNKASHRDQQYNSVTAQSPINHKHSVTNPLHNDYQDPLSMECAVEPIHMHSNSIPQLPNFSSDISCTLCRRLPRRNSFTDSSQRDDSHREPLRKSKSDGEIKLKRYIDHRHGGVEMQSVLQIAEGFQHVGHFNINNQFNSRSRNENIILRRGSYESDDNEMSMSSTETYNSCDTTGDLVMKSPTIEDDQLRTMKKTLKSIGDLLKETRIEVECTNSELREEVVTLENTVVSLMDEMTMKKEPILEVEREEEVTVSLPLRKLFQRHNSLTSSKECHCCSQAMRPALEDVISKLQQLTDLVDNTSLHPTRTSRSTSQEVTTIEVIDPSLAEGRSEKGDSLVETAGTPSCQTEVHKREIINVEEECKLEADISKVKEINNISDHFLVKEEEPTRIDGENDNAIYHNIVETTKGNANITVGNQIHHQASKTKREIEENYHVHAAERPKHELNNNILIELPLSEDINNVSTTDRLIYQLEFYRSTDI